MVSNVRAGQRAGTKLVDIDYHITGTTGWVSVSVQVSSDAGASYAVPALAFTGDFGSVPAGRNRRVTWNAGADWNGSYSPSMRFKITASEALAGMVLIPAAEFPDGELDECRGGIQQRVAGAYSVGECILYGSV